MRADSSKMAITPIHNHLISKWFDAYLTDVYSVYTFIIHFFREVFTPPIEWKEIINQCYQVGYKSLPLVSLTGFITGVVFTKQSRPSLSSFGASSWLPSLVTIAIIRALAPLVTRITTITMMMPILILYTGFVGMMGAYFNVRGNESTSFLSFFESAFKSIVFLDIFSALFKALCYGFTIGVAGCYQGYYAKNGTQGVGRAANMAVVHSKFLIFIEEIIIVQVVNGFR